MWKLKLAPCSLTGSLLAQAKVQLIGVIWPNAGMMSETNTRRRDKT